MEVEGVIIKAMPTRSGSNERGAWMTQDYVLEVSRKEDWKTHMVFTVFGSDSIQRFNIKEGQKVNVSFNIDAREHEGRWYNTIRAFDVRQRYDEAEVTPLSDSSINQAETNPFGESQQGTLPFD